MEFFYYLSFSAKTIIYFLLRKEIDSTDVSDVYLEDDEQKTEMAGTTKKEDDDSSSGKGKQGNPSPGTEGKP